MKKLFYVLVLSFVATLSITSCTEETIEPLQDNGGGQVIEKEK